MKDNRKIIIYLFLAGLLIRFFYFYEMVDSPYYGAPFLDELYHINWAKEIAYKDFVGKEVFFRAPFYSYILALQFKITGSDLFFALLFQHIIGAISVIIIFLISDKLFSKQISIVAGLLAAFYAPFFFNENQFFDTYLTVFLYLLIVLMSLLCLEKSSGKLFFLTGLLNGFGAITRPNILLFSFCLIVIFTIYLKKQGASFSIKLFRNIGIFIVGLFLPILPVTVRNAAVGKCFIPISSYGGINFYIGNNPNSDGYTPRTAKHYQFVGKYRDSVELFAEREAERQLNKDLNATEVQSFWINKGISFIFSEPLSAMKLFAKKTILFFSTIEIKNNKNIYFVANYSVVLKILLKILPFGIIFPFAAAGIFFALKMPEFKKNIWLLIAVFTYLLTQALSVIIFFISDRHRIPFVPLLFPFSVVALISFIRIIREREYKLFIYPFIIFCVTAALSNIDWFKVYIKDLSRDYWSVGNCYLQQGNLDEALKSYFKAREYNDDDTDIINNIGEVYYKKGDLDEAQKYFEKALAIDEKYLKALNNLGVVFEQKGDLAQAELYYKKVLEIEPEHALCRTNLADTLLKSSRPDEALKEYITVLKDNSEYLNALVGISRAYVVLNNFEEAKRNIRKAIEIGGESLKKELEKDELLNEYIN